MVSSDTVIPVFSHGSEEDETAVVMALFFSFCNILLAFKTGWMNMIMNAKMSFVCLFVFYAPKKVQTFNQYEVYYHWGH